MVAFTTISMSWNVTLVSLRYIPKSFSVIVGLTSPTPLIVSSSISAIAKPLSRVIFSPTSIVSPLSAASTALLSESYFTLPIFAVKVSAGGVTGADVSPPVGLLSPVPFSPPTGLLSSVPFSPPVVLFSPAPSLPAVGFVLTVSFSPAFAPVSAVFWLPLSLSIPFAVLLFGVWETGAPSTAVAVPSAVSFSAASAVTGSMVSIIRPARVPARKRLFLLFMQKPPLRAYRRKGGDFLLFGNRLSCGKVRLDPVALRHRLSPAVLFSVQTRPRRIMHRSSCLS